MCSIWTFQAVDLNPKHLCRQSWQIEKSKCVKCQGQRKSHNKRKNCNESERERASNNWESFEGK